MLGNSTESDVDNNTSDLCVIVALSKAHSSGETSTLYGRKLSKVDFGGEGHPFQLTQRNSFYIWENKTLTEEKIRFGSVVKFRKVGDAFVYQGNSKFRRQNVEQIQMDLDLGVSVFMGVNDAFPDAQIAEKKGLFMAYKPGHPTAALISMKYAVIENERITFGTRKGECVNLKLNCRENLHLSPSPVVLQLQHVKDENDVGDVALVKFSTSDCGLRNPCYWAVCEGLILRHKAKIISIDEEPVKIKDHNGRIIPVPGSVKFDTGNNAGTAISEELVEKLDLQPDHNKKRCVTVAGGTVLHCSMVKITVVIRKRRYRRYALVGAQAPETDLLVGMDIIGSLNDDNYTLGK